MYFMTFLAKQLKLSVLLQNFITGVTDWLGQVHVMTFLAKQQLKLSVLLQNFILGFDGYILLMFFICPVSQTRISGKKLNIISCKGIVSKRYFQLATRLKHRFQKIRFRKLYVILSFFFARGDVQTIFGGKL